MSTYTTTPAATPTAAPMAAASPYGASQAGTPVAPPVVTSSTYNQKAPPAGVPAGGSWGTIKHAGPATWSTCTIVSVVTCFFTLLPCGVLMLLCPFDEKPAYEIQGRVYDEGGKYLGDSGRTKFRRS